MSGYVLVRVLKFGICKELLLPLIALAYRQHMSHGNTVLPHMYMCGL